MKYLKKIYYFTLLLLISICIYPVHVYDPALDFFYLKNIYKWLTPELYQIIYVYSNKYNTFSINDICAIIQYESGNYCNNNTKYMSRVKSYMGAIGYMQIMPFHHNGDKNELCDPKINIAHGTRIFDMCIKRANGDKQEALRYYNAGIYSNKQKYKNWDNYVFPIIKLSNYSNNIIKYYEKERKKMTITQIIIIILLFIILSIISFIIFKTYSKIKIKIKNTIYIIKRKIEKIYNAYYIIYLLIKYMFKNQRIITLPEIIFIIFNNFYSKNKYELENICAFDNEMFPNGINDIGDMYYWINQIREYNYQLIKNLILTDKYIEFYGSIYNNIKFIIKNGVLNIIPIVDTNNINNISFIKIITNIQNALYELDNEKAKWILDRRKYFNF